MPSKSSLESRRAIRLISVCVAVSSACFFANLPLVPLILLERDPARLGSVDILVGVSFALSAFLSPLWGMLADRYGPRLMMQRAALLIAVAYLAMAFAPNFEWMLASRIFSGLASGLIPAAFTYAIKAVTSDTQGRAFTSLNAARSAGAIIGPAFVALAAFIGTNLVMLVIAAIAATTVVLAGFLPHVPGQGRKAKRPLKARTVPPALSGNPSVKVRFIVLCVSLLGFGSVASGLLTALPLTVAKAAPELAFLIAGAMFAIAGGVTLAVAVPWGILIDRKGLRLPALIATSGASAAVLLVAVIAEYAPIAWVIVLAYVLFCAFSTELSAIASILNGRMTGASGLGQGIQNSLVQASAAMGPLAVGLFVADLVNFYWVAVMVMIACTGLLLMTIHWTAPLEERSKMRERD